MTTTIGSKIKGFIILAVVLGVVMAAFQYLPAAHTSNGKLDPERQVTFLVTFDPSVREKEVTISHTDKYAGAYEDATRLSPWSNTRMFRIGTVVALMAFQSEGTSNRLECFIKQGDEVIAADVRHGIGAVTCQATVR
jgi:hypothetical protein